MKPGLQRIEATLNQLSGRGPRPVQAGVPTEPLAPASEGSGLSDSRTAYSFKLQTKPKAKTRLTVPAVLSPAAPPPNEPTSPTDGELPQSFVPPFPVAVDDTKIPALPRFKSPSFSNHRHAPNPALALNLLQEIQSVVTRWQTELHQIVRQVQDLYLEGPIVDGWLESFPQGNTADATVLRHGEVKHLLTYVEQICPPGQQPLSSQAPPVLKVQPGTGYRLCGLNADGQLWSRPCPAEQVPSVSLAISRHQKLRQLLGRKQYLETRLSQLAETLVMVHGQLNQMP